MSASRRAPSPLRRTAGPKHRSPPKRASEIPSFDLGYGIVFDPTFDTLLSAPEEVYALTAKYQVPELRPVIV